MLQREGAHAGARGAVDREAEMDLFPAAVNFLKKFGVRRVEILAHILIGWITRTMKSNPLGGTLEVERIRM